MSFTRPTLSMWTPNYNHSHYVGKALESVLTQTRLPDQYVVADDASTDNSVEIIQPFADRSPCVEFYKHPQNLGALGNLNFCLEKMTGDYIYGLSADDFILPGWLEAAMGMAERYPEAGIIFGQTQILSSFGFGGYDRAECWTEAQYVSPERFLKEYLLTPKRETLLICSTIYKRSVFDSVGGFTRDLPRYNDWWAFIMCGLKAGACYVPMPAHSIMLESGNNFAAKLSTNSDFYIDILERFRARARRPEFQAYFPEPFLNELVERRKSYEIEQTVWIKYGRRCLKRDRFLEKSPALVRRLSRLFTGLYKIGCHFQIAAKKFYYRFFYKPDLESPDLEKTHLQKMK